jgi:uncharacterized protein YjbJ (UPF0337 family)
MDNMNLPSMWQKQVGSARIAWGKLTRDELLQSEGHAHKLIDLIQERYAITHREADRQVNCFIKFYKC